jgi:hypothetical protein
MARPEDVFGDVKVPRFEALNSSEADDGWKDVPPVLEPEDYSSAVGLRVLGLLPGKETNFTLESSYLAASCDQAIQLPYSLNWTRRDVERLSTLMNFNFSATAESGWLPGAKVKNGGPGAITWFFLDTDRKTNFKRALVHLGLDQGSADGPDPQLTRPRRLVVGFLYRHSAQDSRYSINLSNCSVTETHQESAVTCPGEVAGGDCRVHRVRLSQVDKRLPFVTRLEPLASRREHFRQSAARTPHNPLPRLRSP